MSFLKETNDRGSRAYESDRPAPVLLDDFRLRIALSLAWARLQIEKFMRLGAPSPKTSLLINHGEKHFTLLGGGKPALPARRSIAEIFPIPNFVTIRARSNMHVAQIPGRGS